MDYLDSDLGWNEPKAAHDALVQDAAPTEIPPHPIAEQFIKEDSFGTHAEIVLVFFSI